MDEIAQEAGWCWFGDPRAVYHKGFLYYGWVATNGNIWVAQVDTATWTRRRQLIAAGTHIDDHNNPSLVVRGDRLCVFWCGHGGSSMRYRIASAPNSVAGWGAVITCSAGNTPGASGFTYPNPVNIRHNRNLYLFWRGGNFQPTYSRSASITGNAWTPAQHLFSTTAGERPYVKVIGDNTNRSRIHFLMTDAHPGNLPTSIYYVRWHTDDGTFRKADGTVVGDASSLPVPVADLDRVYDGSGNPRAWTWDLQLDSAGRPHAAFTVLHGRDRHEYWAARHNGTAWTVAKVADAGGTIAQNTENYYSGGIVLDPLDLDTVALSRQPAPDRLHRVERWETSDSGNTWGLAEVVSDSSAQNVRPFFVRGAPARMNWRLMWLQGTYGDFNNWRLRLVGNP